MFYYTRCTTPKRATSLRGSFPCHCTLATQLLTKKCYSRGEWSAILSQFHLPEI